MSGDYLSTTQVGKILGCSRQHVAKLCDSGQLPCERIGRHRRIKRTDLDNYRGQDASQSLRREDEQSLWLAYLQAARVVQDPDGVIERARERLTFLRRTHHNGISDRYFDAWQQALDDGPDAVLEIMTDRGEWGQAMRSASPLSGLGLIDQDERQAVLGAHRRHWQNHGRERETVAV